MKFSGRTNDDTGEIVRPGDRVVTPEGPGEVQEYVRQRIPEAHRSGHPVDDAGYVMRPLIELEDGTLMVFPEDALTAEI